MTAMNQTMRNTHGAGFSMIEVLVTIVLISAGLLGIAGMLARGVSFNNTSFLRSLATQQAYDMGDRLRTNRAGAIAGHYNTINYTANQTCTACSTACTVATMAAYDTCIWNSQNEKLLPLGRGVISRSGADFVITVSWDVNKDGVVDSNDVGHVLRVQP